MTLSNGIVLALHLIDGHVVKAISVRETLMQDNPFLKEPQQKGDSITIIDKETMQERAEIIVTRNRDGDILLRVKPPVGKCIDTLVSHTTVTGAVMSITPIHKRRYEP